MDLMTEEKKGESVEKDNNFSTLSHEALGHEITLKYEGSSNMDYESFLIDKIISLGNLDEETTRKLKLYSNTTFVDPSGNVHSEKLAYFVEAFWNNLNENEKIVLEEDLKGIAPSRLRIEEFKESEFSEQLFESEEGMNKFVGMVSNSLEKALLISLLTGRECKYGIYKNNEGKYFCDSFPRIGDYEGVGSNWDRELHSICMIHTHPKLTDYDPEEKRFIIVDGFSYNPALKGELEVNDKSDWFDFLAYSKNRATVEGVISSNEHLTLLKFNPMDVDSIVTRASGIGIKVTSEDIQILNQEGSYTNVVVRHILRNITNNSYSEDIDEKLSNLFGWDLYKGSIDKIEKIESAK